MFDRRGGDDQVVGAVIHRTARPAEINPKSSRPAGNALLQGKRFGNTEELLKALPIFFGMFAAEHVFLNLNARDDTQGNAERHERV